MQINGTTKKTFLWYHVLKFLKKGFFTTMWLREVNWDTSLVTQYSMHGFHFSFFLLFLHCESCFLLVWARISQTAIAWCFFDVWMGLYQLFNYFSVNWNDVVWLEFYSMFLCNKVREKNITPLFNLCFSYFRCLDLIKK